MSRRDCHWLFVSLGCPVTVSISLTVTSAVGGWSAVEACLLGENDIGRDMEKSSGRVVGVVAMILSLVAAEGWRECYF